MRQSLSERIDRDSVAPRRSSSRAGAAIGSLLGALGLSLALALAALVDQLGARTLMDHATDVYASHGKEPGAGLMYGLVYTVAVVGALLWLGVLAVAWSGRRAASWAAVGSTVVVGALAVTLLAASEYGEQVYPPFWGVVTMLSALAGAAGAVLLVRRSR
ncbi:MAG TPA: hypothetical protein VFV89_03930 [Nocardioides sp.]|uniref:hypothetical protein n=1 Tax=Nocardioides sp. TaxID=35761 RepID=UPI002E320F77|nr:hypothetical protein [Nocardioides sp.]HEX5086932.1 hypothetical protein [Nocardioides sp.]